MSDATIEFCNDFDKFSSEYKQTYPVADEETEKLRVKGNKLINFDKVRNHLFDLPRYKDRKFTSFSNVSVRALDYALDLEIPLTKHVSAIKILDKYETEITSVIEIDFLMPHTLVLLLLKHLARDVVTLRFFIDIVNRDRLDGGDLVTTNPFNYATLESSAPHLSVPYIAVESPTDSLPNTSLELTEDKKQQPFKFSLILVSEYALRVKKAQFMYNGQLSSENENATHIPTIIDEHLEKVRELIPEINVYKKQIDNLQRFPNIALKNSNIFEMVTTLNEMYGMHLFGSNIYLEGNNLHLGDLQLESIGKDIDLFIEVMDDASASDNGSFFEYMREDKPEETRIVNKDEQLNRYYVLTEEAMVKPEYYKAANNELSGEDIVVRYNGKDRSLLLPRNLAPTNVAGDATLDQNDEDVSENKKGFFAKLLAKFSPPDRVKQTSTTNYIKKEQNNYFFETKFLSAYNDARGLVEVYLEGVNPDLFHHGKHLYLHFHNPEHAKAYNWKYKVVVKDTFYPVQNQENSLITPKVRLVLVKLIDELPYYLDDILTNKIYSSNRDFRASPAETKKIDSERLAKEEAERAVAKVRAAKKKIITTITAKKPQPEYISRFITYAEMIKSETAERFGVSNLPLKEHERNFRALCTRVIDPINEHFGGTKKVVFLSSSYRNPKVNALVGGSSTSQHPQGEAGDGFTIPGISNETVWKWVALGDLPFDQLIYEFGRWVHVSHKTDGVNRGQILVAKGTPRIPYYSEYTIEDVQNGDYSLT